MLSIRVDIANEKVLIQSMGHLAAAFPDAVERGLARAAKGVHRIAFAWLSGAKGDPGAYPVPVITGHLRRLLDWIKPGESKSTEAGSVTAGRFEAIIYNSAAYALTIFTGRGSSAKFGERNAIITAFEEFNEGERVAKIVQEEVEKLVNRGMA